MGSDPSEVQETPSLSSVKVHLGICKQFLRLVQKISYILPKIEAVRPGASQGMQALVQLQKANDKAKDLIQNCDSSKLYLAVIGNEIVKRFENTRTLLVQSLSKLQNMVPVVLESQISELLSDLLAAVFYMEPNEALAGKALKALLERDSSLVNSEIELLQIATSALHISSQKDILIERRSIKKLLGKTKDGNSKKKITLTYFFHVLKKYNEQIVQAQARDPLTEDGQIYLPGGLNSDTVIPNTTDLDAHQTSVPYRSSPPEEFICFLCSNLMHDPVIISSGQTFDRSCIQKLFDEGCDTCPKTNTKLTSLLAIPNTSMKGLIFKWSMEYGVNISEPTSSIPENGCLETSYNSICSAASSMNDVNLRMNMSSISLRSLDSSYSSISSHNRSGDSFSYVREVSTVDSYDFQFYRSIDDIQRRFLSNVSGFPWESQCCAVQDVNNFMIYNNPSCSFVSTENFLDPLVQFLHDALDKRDEEALKVGNQLLLTFLKASRTEISQLTDALYNVLASILATQPMTETLSVIEVLSSRANAIPHLESSGILTSITTLLDSHSRDFQETAIKILHDLSMNLDASSCKLASDWIPKLVPFLEDGKVARTIIGIFENLSKFEETRVALAETTGCIASIIKLLEAEISSDAQEHAVGILLFLCAQRSCYCKLVSDEGGVIALFHLSVNGTLKGRSSASELLRLLRDIDEEVGNEQQEYPVLDQDVYEHPSENENSENKPPKSSRFSGWKAKMFSKKK